MTLHVVGREGGLGGVKGPTSSQENFNYSLFYFCVFLCLVSHMFFYLLAGFSFIHMAALS